MITDKKSASQMNEYYGLSTDTKPDNPPNGSCFYEMDTTNLYMWDRENATWIKQ